MRKAKFIMALFILLMLLPVSSLAATRALLIACSDFVTQPDLGHALSGNLHMIGSALLGAKPRLASLSIEDGTIASADALERAIADSLLEASEEDLSIIYLCTHGHNTPDASAAPYLLLSDGTTESRLTADALYEMLAPIQGEKLLILDACFSGALVGRSTHADADLFSAPFLRDSSMHVLTSASSFESSWYYNSEQLSTGAVSYFASALSTGLGLYGALEADANGDGSVTLSELHSHLLMAVPSSTSQLLSSSAGALSLPASQNAMLTRPLMGFSYGLSLLRSDDPTFDFSFTVAKETAVQYRLIDFDEGKWDWENAQTFLDEGENGMQRLTPGRKTRTLTLPDVAPQDSGYLMLQIFAVSGDTLTLCSERLIAVQPAETDATLHVRCSETFIPGSAELRAEVMPGVPAEITVSVFNQEGELIRRLCSSQMTRPTPGDCTSIYWDGRDESGALAPSGVYTLAAEARIGGKRQKAMAQFTIPAADD